MKSDVVRPRRLDVQWWEGKKMKEICLETQ